MATNDRLLLDTLLDKSGTRWPIEVNQDEAFEAFCAEQVLKKYDPSTEEILSGITDGPDDGGIDAGFVLVNGVFVADSAQELSVGPQPTVTLHLLTARRSPTFQQSPVNALVATLPRFLDLSLSHSELSRGLNPRVVALRERFRAVMLALVDKHPDLSISVTYACKGDIESMPENVKTNLEQVGASIKGHFSNATITVQTIGAGELLHMARRRPRFSLRLRFVENPLSRGESNYVFLCPLGDYHAFTCDDDGQLRRHLFESNVRDFVGAGAVNQEILRTLAEGDSQARPDFWWLNNGITMLASSATIVGKEVSLENVCIVNGLQTTECIYRHMASRGDRADARAILVRVIVTESADVSDKIIRGTNLQTPVETASLYATETLQRDIEEALEPIGWYYDRRKNFHRNRGIPQERIVSMSYVGACIQALVHGRPDIAREQRTRYMRMRSGYEHVFNPQWDIRVYAVCLRIAKEVEGYLGMLRHYSGLPFQGKYHELRFILAWAYVAIKSGSAIGSVQGLISLAGEMPTKADVVKLLNLLGEGLRRYSEVVGGIWKPAQRIRLVNDVSFIQWWGGWLEKGSRLDGAEGYMESLDSEDLQWFTEDELKGQGRTSFALIEQGRFAEACEYFRKSMRDTARRDIAGLGLAIGMVGERRFADARDQMIKNAGMPQSKAIRVQALALLKLCSRMLGVSVDAVDSDLRLGMEGLPGFIWRKSRVGEFRTAIATYWPESQERQIALEVLDGLSDGRDVAGSPPE